jgi:hypothetical protein
MQFLEAVAKKKGVAGLFGCTKSTLCSRLVQSSVVKTLSSMAREGALRLPGFQQYDDLWSADDLAVVWQALEARAAATTPTAATAATPSKRKAAAGTSAPNPKTPRNLRNSIQVYTPRGTNVAHEMHRTTNPLTDSPVFVITNNRTGKEERVRAATADTHIGNLLHDIEQQTSDADRLREKELASVKRNLGGALNAVQSQDAKIAHLEEANQQLRALLQAAQQREVLAAEAERRQRCDRCSRCAG